MKKYILLIIAIAYALNAIAQNTGDFRSRQDGNWNDFNTWERFDGISWIDAISGQTPTLTNNVTIISGHLVVLNAGPAQAANLTIDGTFQHNSSFVFTVNGNLTISSSGIYQTQQIRQLI